MNRSTKVHMSSIDWNDIDIAGRKALCAVVDAATFGLVDLQDLVKSCAVQVPELGGRLLHEVADTRPDACKARQVERIVERARADGWLHHLVDMLERQCPRNAEVRHIRSIVGSAGSLFEHARKDAGAAPGIEYQAAVNKLGYLEVRDLFKRLAHICQTTVAVELNSAGRRDAAMGTGILIAPDLVLTNWHVMKRFLVREGGRTEAKPADGVVCRFDYDDEVTSGPGRREPNGQIVPLQPGLDWLVASSPNSDVERLGGRPGSDELDFALLRLRTPAPPLLGGGERQPITAISRETQLPGRHEPLMVVQHPLGGPLAVAYGKAHAWTDQSPRFAYDADTKSGSSGSGVFKLPQGDLVVLHHGGAEGVKNQGIPMYLITAEIAPVLASAPHDKARTRPS